MFCRQSVPFQDNIVGVKIVEVESVSELFGVYLTKDTI